MIHVLLLAAALLVASPAVAAPEIGKATEITTEVTGDAAGSIRVLKAGDQVFQEERIATDDKGIGQLEFHDDTRLAIGPGSVVKLDRFVYGANRSATAVTVQLTKGAFRFISGKSASAAYQIATPTATIGAWHHVRRIRRRRWGDGGGHDRRRGRCVRPPRRLSGA